MPPPNSTQLTKEEKNTMKEYLTDLIQGNQTW